MELQSVTTILHVLGTGVPTKMQIPACQKCGYMDTKSPEVQEAFRLAEERVRKERGARRNEAHDTAEAPAGESTAAPSCAKCGGPLARYEVPVILTMDHSFRCPCEEPGFYVDVRTDVPLLGCPSCKEFVVDGPVTQDAIFRDIGLGGWGAHRVAPGSFDRMFGLGRNGARPYVAGRDVSFLEPW